MRQYYGEFGVEQSTEIDDMGEAQAASRTEMAEYLASTLDALSKIADRAGLDVLGHLLRTAQLEAEHQALTVEE